MRLQKFVLFIGDVLSFYAALILALFVHYGTEGFAGAFSLHFFPFTFLFFVWFLIFLMNGLYENEILDAGSFFQEKLAKTMLAGFIIGIVIFYAVPAFGIAPKTNLAIDAFLTAIFILAWRKLMALIFAKSAKKNIMFFGFSKEAKELCEFLKSHPSLGYNPLAVIFPRNGKSNETNLLSFDLNDNAASVIKENNISLIVALEDIRNEKDFLSFIYQALPQGIAFMDFPTFYERIFGKIPISLIHEIWFLENLSEIKKNIYETIKRGLDVFLALILGLITLIFLPIIAIAIKLNSRGPVFIFQQRIGKNRKIFNLAKFRSMLSLTKEGLAEPEGVKWTKEKDERITRVGKILRKTRFDELPQVLNILMGEMSFVGPRPERPEFIEKLEKQIPHYQMRHLIKPGLTGWAQINFPYGASVEDAMEKLQYDLFYIKNRSLFLDFIIALKTIITLLSRSGR